MNKKSENSDSKVSSLDVGESKKDSYIFGLFDAREKSLIPLQLTAITLAVIETVQGFRYIINPETQLYEHTLAHLGAYSLAYAAALFVVGFKPARARGLLILFVVATIGFLATSAIDVIQGNAEFATELQHVTKLIPPIIVWLISQRAIHKFPLPKN